MKVARQFTAWYPSENAPSRRERFDPEPQCLPLNATVRNGQPDHTVPYGTGPVSTQIPGSKLPGYDHGVPTGQKSDTSEKCMGIFR
jgi:hypothetical protein